MKGILATIPMSFRMEPEYKDKLQKLGNEYGTCSMTKVLKRLIDDRYSAEFINPQQNTKEGKTT